MQDNKVSVADVGLTHEAIRAAGGIVHKDGNIFFTNITMLNSAIEQHVLPPMRGTGSQQDASALGLTSDLIEELWNGIDGIKVISTANQLNWNAAVREAFARAIEREVLATRQSVDVGGLTRYEPSREGTMDVIVDDDIGLNPDTEYVKLADVQRLLTTKAAGAVQPVSAAEQLEKAEFDLDAYERLCQSKDSRIAELEARLARQEQAAPVAYLHEVVAGDGVPDQALSFAPDNFPLAGTLGYRSISHRPLCFAAPTLGSVPQAAAPIHSNLEVLTAEAKRYRDLTNECITMGYPGLVDAVESLRKAAYPSAQAERAAVPIDELRFAIWGFLRSMDEYAETNGTELVPINRQSAMIRELRSLNAAPVAQEGEHSDSSMPVDMSQACRWITQLRERVDSLLAIINAQPTPSKECEQSSTDASAQALADMEGRKDAAYLERNQVVAALAKCFPSGLARTAIEGWSEDWHDCVYIDLPSGQVSWHFHDSQAYLFDGLPQYTGKWDGHDTPEKYRRVAALSATHPTPSDSASVDTAEGGNDA